MKQFGLILSVLFLLIAGSFTACEEPENAGVEMIITDPYDRAIPNAKVSFYNLPGNLLIEAQGFTNEAGRFYAEFAFLANLRVYVQVDNYQGQRLVGETEVTLARGETQEIPLQLAAPTTPEEEEE